MLQSIFTFIFIANVELNGEIKDYGLHGLQVAFGITGAIAAVVIAFGYGVFGDVSLSDASKETIAAEADDRSTKAASQPRNEDPALTKKDNTLHEKNKLGDVLRISDRANPFIQSFVAEEDASEQAEEPVTSDNKDRNPDSDEDKEEKKHDKDDERKGLLAKILDEIAD